MKKPSEQITGAEELKLPANEDEREYSLNPVSGVFEIVQEEKAFHE